MPEVQVNSIDFWRRREITLYVPESMISQYKASDWWKDFKDILPLPDEYNGIKTPSASPLGERTGAVYDLSGRRLEQKPQKGIYINNGKKVIIQR